MRASVLVLALLAVAARPVGAEPIEGGSVMGLGFGPAPAVSGALAGHFRGDGIAARVRMGVRGGPLGVEIAIVSSGLAGEDPAADAGAVLWTPTVAYYPVANPWFQLGARAGLGLGKLSGGDGDGHAIFALDTGVTAQVHLGRRRGGRAILWIDGGVQLARVHIDDAVVAGRIVQVTVGIAHGTVF